MVTYSASLPDALMLDWTSQYSQYPRIGDPGIDYFPGWVDGFALPVDCLLWRDHEGLLRGVLNHYSMDYPPYERAGNFGVWIDPSWRRRGIATALLNAARARWTIDLGQQLYSQSGAAWINAVEGGG